MIDSIQIPTQQQESSNDLFTKTKTLTGNGIDADTTTTSGDVAGSNTSQTFTSIQLPDLGFQIEYPSYLENDCPSVPPNRCFFNVYSSERWGLMISVFAMSLEELKNMYQENILP